MNTPNLLEKKYEALCTEDGCYSVVKEDDIERGTSGEVYERSKKCWDCRTPQDKRAIKNFRSKQNKKTTFISSILGVV